MTHRWRAAAFLLLLGFVAQKPTRGAADEAQWCVVIQPLKGGDPAAAGAACQTRFSPASTFKIPHALVALETGVVSTDTQIRWDGTRYQRQLKWNQDHTIISALRPSALWVFQRIAPKIGG